MADYLMLVGTYTRREPHVAGQAEGIYGYRFHADSGQLTHVSTTAGIANPSYLTTDPSRGFVYAVSEIGDLDGGRTGGVAAYALDESAGSLQPLNVVRSQGQGPCYVSVDAAGACVLVANYGSGSLALLPIGVDGALGDAKTKIQHRGSGINVTRQEGPHAHSITIDPQNRYAIAADLGTDELRVYALNAAQGTLTPHSVAHVTPGAGPRHIAFHPDRPWLYVINELDSTITTCDYDATRGVIVPRQSVSTVPPEFTGENTCADIHVHPSGRYVYGSNRGHDSIAIFAVHEENGDLAAHGHVSTEGRTPRNFTLSRDGRYLLAANQDTSDVVVFRIDPQSGRIAAIHKAHVPSPVCLHLLD